jgi:SAM-dependent methyltransferase
MMIANVEMAAAWDGSEGDEWTEDADYYEAASERTWARFLTLVPVAATDRVLDIGCGTGHSTRSMAARAGYVLGVDLSSRMLNEARRRAAAEGLTNVEFVQADAQVRPFETGGFDLAISSFGAMFFNDPIAAFTNIGAALRPASGTLAILSWQGLAENEWLRAYLGALDAGRNLAGPPVGAPGAFGLTDPDDVRRILTAAGFAGIELTSIEEPMRVGADFDDAWSFVQRLGVVKGLTENLDDDSKRQAFADLRRVVADHTSPDGVLLGTAAWLITATRG